MLTSKRHRSIKPGKLTIQKTGSINAAVYHFPQIQGLEDISAKMAAITADSLFSALLKGYDLSPIESEEQAEKAERFLEYLLRAFEKTCPRQAKTYLHLLEMLISEYDQEQTVAAVKDIPPHILLKAILDEEQLDQKSLVPSCFKSASQVSEFLSQKKGREKLTAQQAIKLGKRFHLDPLLFFTDN